MGRKSENSLLLTQSHCTALVGSLSVCLSFSLTHTPVYLLVFLLPSASSSVFLPH